jgi:GNAT superfamily N-acetyltransferase
MSTRTLTFLVDGRLEGYPTVGKWLITATLQGDSTIIKAEPGAVRAEATPEWVVKDESVLGGKSRLAETTRDSARLCFFDKRSEQLLSQDPEAMGSLEPQPLSAPEDEELERLWQETLRDKDRLCAYLSHGGLLRLSMKLASRPGLAASDQHPAWTIRRYRPEDVRAMVRLYSWYDDTSLDPDEWNQSWQAEHTLIGQTESKICGFCLPLPGTRIGLSPRLGIIGEIYVEPGYRRRGLGRTLLDRAVRVLSEFAQVRTGATLPNPAAYALLTQAGFVTESVKPMNPHSVYIRKPG